MSRNFRIGIAATLASVALPAAAQVNAIDFIDNGIYLGFDGQLTGAQLLIDLTAGSIVNPDNHVMPAGLGHDTFVAIGSSDPFGNTPGIAGAAVDLGASSEMSTAGQAFNLAWYAPIGSGATDRSDFLSAQVALTPDAHGTFSYLASANGAISTVSSVVEDGRLVGADFEDYHSSSGTPANDVMEKLIYSDRFSHGFAWSPDPDAAFSDRHRGSNFSYVLNSYRYTPETLVAPVEPLPGLVAYEPRWAHGYASAFEPMLWSPTPAHSVVPRGLSYDDHFFSGDRLAYGAVPEPVSSATLGLVLLVVTRRRRGRDVFDGEWGGL